MSCLWFSNMYTIPSRFLNAKLDVSTMHIIANPVTMCLCVHLEYNNFNIFICKPEATTYSCFVKLMDKLIVNFPQNEGMHKKLTNMSNLTEVCCSYVAHYASCSLSLHKLLFIIVDTWTRILWYDAATRFPILQEMVFACLQKRYATDYCWDANNIILYQQDTYIWATNI